MIKKLVCMALLMNGFLCAMQEDADRLVSDEQILKTIFRLQVNKRPSSDEQCTSIENAPKRVSRSAGELPLGSQGELPEDPLWRRVCLLIENSAFVSALNKVAKEGLVEEVLNMLLIDASPKNASVKAAREQTGRGGGCLVSEEKGNISPHKDLQPPVYFP